jgi:hypothetical protein
MLRSHLLAKVEHFQALLSISRIDLDQPRFLTLFQPLENMFVLDDVNSKRVTGRAKKLGIRGEAAEIIHDRHKSAIEQFPFGAERIHALARQDSFTENPYWHLLAPNCSNQRLAEHVRLLALRLLRLEFRDVPGHVDLLLLFDGFGIAQVALHALSSLSI